MAQLHPCCYPSSPSVIWEGTPTGQVTEIDGIETYISLPGMRDDGSSTTKQETSNRESANEPRRVILFLTEAHGIYLPNSQLLADSFASHLDCDVIMPDQFPCQVHQATRIAAQFTTGKEAIPETVPWTGDNNDPNCELRGVRVPLRLNTETSDAYPFQKAPGRKEEGPADFEAWKMRHDPSVTDPILARVIKYIYDKYGRDAKIGGVGYCFGGRYIIRLMGSGLIDVGVVNHPSFFTMQEVSLLRNGKRIAIYAAETDDILTSEKRRETEDMLTKVGATWMSTVFSGTEHGFSVRGDLTQKKVRMAKECAFKGALSWLDAWM